MWSPRRKSRFRGSDSAARRVPSATILFLRRRRGQFCGVCEARRNTPGSRDVAPHRTESANALPRPARPHSRSVSPVTARTVATMPVRTSAGGVGHASTTAWGSAGSALPRSIDGMSLARFRVLLPGLPGAASTRASLGMPALPMWRCHNRNRVRQRLPKSPRSAVRHGVGQDGHRSATADSATMAMMRARSGLFSDGHAARSRVSSGSFVSGDAGPELTFCAARAPDSAAPPDAGICNPLSGLAVT